MNYIRIFCVLRVEHRGAKKMVHLRFVGALLHTSPGRPMESAAAAAGAALRRPTLGGGRRDGLRQLRLPRRGLLELERATPREAHVGGRRVWVPGGVLPPAHVTLSACTDAACTSMVAQRDDRVLRFRDFCWATGEIGSLGDLGVRSSS